MADALGDYLKTIGRIPLLTDAEEVHLGSLVRQWQDALFRAVVQAKECGHLAEQADAAQIAFEIHGLILALHYEARFLQKPGSLAQANQGFENILQRNDQTQGAATRQV